MNLLKTLLIAIALAATFNATARQATDTIYTSSGDRLIISYNVVNNDGKVEIRFTNLKKRLCSDNKEKYDDLAEISVMCFDRNSFNDVTFKGLSPTTIIIPSEFKYIPSDDGFLNLEERPVLVFEGAPDNVFRLIIPMYLVHYERRHHYKILAQCDNLKITEEPKRAQQPAPVVTTQPESSLDLLIAEGPGITETEIAALTSIRYIEEELSTNSKLPFSNELLEKVEELKQLKLTVKNKETVARIDTMLDVFENKKIVLEFQAQEEEKRVKDSADYAQCNTIETYEAYIKDHPDGAYVAEAKKKKAQLEDQTEAQASKEKNFKTWLIVGGILLVDLLILGTLLARYVRKKNHNTKSEEPQPKKRKRKKDNDFVATI
jgi:hypothetical protein